MILDFFKRGRLKAQSIHALCQPTRFFRLVQQQPMLVPYSKDKIRVSGKSKGLSAASYDVSIDHDLVLGPHPGHILKRAMLAKYDFDCAHRRTVDLRRTEDEIKQIYREASDQYKAYEAAMEELRNAPPNYSLAYTVEDFYMPHRVTADVADKSTYARLFVSAYNTFIDPGFVGNLQLEIVNDSAEYVEVKAGDPICQIIFSWTDGKTNRPYDGKYQFQHRGIVTARLENEDGSGYTEKHV